MFSKSTVTVYSTVKDVKLNNWISNHKQTQIEYVSEGICLKWACKWSDCSFFLLLASLRVLSRGFWSCSRRIWGGFLFFLFLVLRGASNMYLCNKARLYHAKLVLGTTKLVVDEQRVLAWIELRTFAEVFSNLLDMRLWLDKFIDRCDFIMISNYFFEQTWTVLCQANKVGVELEDLQLKRTFLSSDATDTRRHTAGDII